MAGNLNVHKLERCLGWSQYPSDTWHPFFRWPPGAAIPNYLQTGGFQQQSSLRPEVQGQVSAGPCSPLKPIGETLHCPFQPLAAARGPELVARSP